MKKLLWIIFVSISIQCFSQTDTLKETYNESQVVAFSKGRFIGLKFIRYDRTITWLTTNDSKEFLNAVIEPGSDTTILISTDKKYISIDHKSASYEYKEDFSVTSRYIIQAQNKKYGIVDSLCKYIVEPVYDEVYELDQYNLKYIIRQKKLWGFVRLDGTVITPQYSLPLHGWDGEEDKVKSIRHFLDSNIAYMYYEKILVNGDEMYCLVMSKKGKPVYLHSETSNEVIPDKKSE